MAENIFDKFVIDIVFNNKKFDDSTKKINNDIQSFAGVATKSLGFLGAGLSGVLGINGLKNLVTGFANTGSQIQYVADSLADGTKNLQLFQKAAEQNGGTIDGLNSTLSNLSSHLTAMQNGQDIQFSSVLSGIGINNISTDGKGNPLTPTELLREIGEGLSKLPVSGLNSQRQFEKELGINPNDIRFLIGSRSEVQSRLDRAENSGTLDQQQINAATQAKTSLVQLSEQFDYTKNVLTSKFIPSLTKSFEVVNSIFEGNFFKKFIDNSDKNNIVVKGLQTYRNFSSIFQDNTPANKLASKISGGQVFSKYFTHLADKPEDFNSLISGKPISKNNVNKNNDKNFVPYWNSPAVLAAQLQRENPKRNNNADTYDKINGRYVGHYGLYQISTEAAKDATGKDYLPNDLRDPEINLKVRNQIFDKYAKELQDRGITDIYKITGAAAARFNGGMKDQEYYLKTGKSFNSSRSHPMDYSNEINYNAAHKYANLNSDAQESQVTNINVTGGIHMHDVQDVQGFSNTIEQLSRTRSAMTFSGSRNS